MQLVHAIPNAWKQLIRDDFPPDLAPHAQGVLLCTRLIPTENLNSKQLYDIWLRNENHIPTVQAMLQRKFPLVEPNAWKKSTCCPEKQSNMRMHAISNTRY
jgi:hypothetical protein